jgi:hypothetical protein
LFFGGFGGSSHYNWVLTILDETISRGHNVTFLATVSKKVEGGYLLKK